MLNATEDFTDSLIEEPFPKDADIRITIAGLAYCQLKPEESKINFLSHVPHHKLDLTIIERRRDSKTPTFKLETQVNINQTVFINADNSITPAGIEVKGNFPLSEIINISQLHTGGKKIIKYKKNIPADCVPIKMTVNDCGFYTAKKTINDFEITDGVVSETKKIGYVMGGKIECRTGGNINIEVKGANSLKIERPMIDADGEFVYDIILDNHCVDTTKCEAEFGGDGDFKYYYDVLEDPDDPKRQFTLKKVSTPGNIQIEGVDVAACNVIITEP